MSRPLRCSRARPFGLCPPLARQSSPFPPPGRTGGRTRKPVTLYGARGRAKERGAVGTGSTVKTSSQYSENMVIMVLSTVRALARCVACHAPRKPHAESADALLRGGAGAAAGSCGPALADAGRRWQCLAKRGAWRGRARRALDEDVLCLERDLGVVAVDDGRQRHDAALGVQHHRVHGRVADDVQELADLHVRLVEFHEFSLPSFARRGRW